MLSAMVTFTVYLPGVVGVSSVDSPLSSFVNVKYTSPLPSLPVTFGVGVCLPSVQLSMVTIGLIVALVISTLALSEMVV